MFIDSLFLVTRNPRWWPGVRRTGSILLQNPDVGVTGRSTKHPT